MMYVVSWRTCATCAQHQQGILYPGTRKALEDLAMEASVWRSPAAASCAVTTPNRIPGSSFAGTQLSGRAWSCYSGSGFGLCRGLQLSFMGHLPVNSPAPDNRVVGAVAQIAAVRDESKAVLRRYTFADLSDSELKDLQARPRIDFTTIYDRVRPIIDDVHTRGDAAVKEYTAKFDKVKLDNVVDLVHELPDPVLDPDVRAAFDVAYANIYKFHAAQQKSQQLEVSTMQGVSCRRVARSINSVGLYVPGGTAVLPSTALMLAVPAQIAGCKTVIIATPPRPDGSICPEVLYCAKKAGAKYILKAGGAQAIAAMAWGTESCPKVDKILGPGNQYVTAAKMLLQNSEAMISIDMPAGPSEVLVIADKHASPVHLAADLLSQAEHGPDSQVVLVVVGDVDIGAIERELNKQCNALPRGDTAAQALAHSFTVIAADMDEACAFSNLYAPEHLIVNVDDAEKWLDKLENAGSVFLGKWTPESVGDYASGTNHVLPTYGYARMYAGVSLDSFVRYMTVQSLTKEGLQLLGPSVEKMAEVEGLDAHKRAVSLRLRDIEALVV